MTARPEFPTPEMRAAERELDARIDVGLAAARDLQDTMDRIANQEADAEAAEAEAEPAPLPDAGQLQTLVTGYAMTPEWRAVTERIDRGTLSWDEVLTSLRAGKADPEVVAAFRSLAKVPPPSPKEMAALGLGPTPEEKPADPPEERRKYHR
ncbi:hypothetical protein CGZ98_19715 [Enemella evansiae]|uniref:hypothetical protein n=1 Tax=Enemella evansiae TaxID=2016499 RepID=UPI000B96CB16|nr:hypothetical protein [Enemella evansiae]OYO07141.1 hypothetical protein CGZ98_19715 [Enemella evansiae]